MNAARIRVDGRLIADLLGFKHVGDVTAIAHDQPGVFIFTVEHYTLPKVEEGEEPLIGHLVVTEKQRTVEFLPD